MNDIPDGYYRAENGMVKQKPEHDVLDSQVELLDTAILANLDKDALIALIQRIGAARWGEVAGMDDNAIESAFRLKLAHGGLTQADMFKALPVMKEWFDRTLGKAPQSIAMKLEVNPLGKMQTDRLLVLERELAKLTGQEALVIAPEPIKVDS